MESNEPSVKTTPVTQEKAHFRRGLPEWMRQLPQLRFPAPKQDFQLIDAAELQRILKEQNISDATIDQILREMRDIDHDLVRLFRERDYEASEQQNRYRLYQLGYMFLATSATFFGSLQALAFGSDPRWVPAFALIQTIIAGFTTFLSFISTREPPLQRWMDNRRKAEFLRREYFRYLIGLTPYDDPRMPRYGRKRELAIRAARANEGQYPEELYLEQ